MESFLGFFSLALLLCSLATVPLYFRNIRKFIELIESNCPDDWKAMGSPRLDASMNARSSWLLVRYLLSGDYKRTGIREVIRYGNQSKFMLVVGLSILLTFVLVAWLGSLFLNG